MSKDYSTVEMENRNLQFYKPCEALQAYVRYYYILKCNESFTIPTFPLACTQIIFHRKTPLYIPQLDTFQDRFTISGQVNFPTDVSSNGNTEMIVVVFKPHSIGAFIDISPAEFYNREISGYDICSPGLNELASRVFDCESSENCINLIERYLLSRIPKAESINFKRLNAAVSLILDKPYITTRNLASVCCLSTKQFNRIFRDLVGMNPKEYSQIVRFQKAMWMFQHGMRDFADIAYTLGYSDQSHFGREFKQYSSITPGRMIDSGVIYSDLYSQPV